MPPPQPTRIQTLALHLNPCAASPPAIPSRVPDAVADADIPKPLDEVWAVVSPFNTLDKWWPIYTDFKADGDKVGSVRTFGFKGRAGVRVTETLVARDKGSFVYTGDTESPLGTIKGVITKVELTAQPGGASTHVRWVSWSPPNTPPMVISTQQSGYKGGLDFLYKYFFPVIGRLDVVVKSVSGIPPHHLGLLTEPVMAYVALSVDGGAFHLVHASGLGSAPAFPSTPASLDVLKQDSELRVMLCKMSVGADGVVGAASVSVQKVMAGRGGRAAIKVPLTPDGELELDLTLQLKNGTELGLTPQQAQEAVVARAAQILKERLTQIVGDLTQSEKPEWEYTIIPEVPQMPGAIRGLPASQALPPHKVALMLQRVTEFAFTQLSLPKRLAAVSPGSYDKYKAYFDPVFGIAAPKFLDGELWASDAEFLRQIFQGCNPMTVRVVKSAAEVPERIRALRAGADSVDALIQQDRLFIIDYAELRALKQHPGGFFYAPTLVFYHTGGDDLRVLGIQLDPQLPIYTPNSPTPNRYLLAKLHVACADQQVHQFIWHLGFAHLAVEPMAIAAHNALEVVGHPLGDVLKIHFRDTIGINYLARMSLVTQDTSQAITNNTFAVGTDQGQRLVFEAYSKFDFLSSGFPQQLQARGFGRPGTDKLKVFRYRDDGYLIWDAIEEYATGVVDALYKTDADVAADKAVQKWAAESADPTKGNLRGFPRAIATKALLVQCLSIIIWTASALHSALNYTQYPYTSTPINRPATMFEPMPPGTADIAQADIVRIVPDGKIALFQGLLSWLLATPEEPTLKELAAPPTPSWARDKMDAVAARFKARLEQAEATITQRNKGALLPYDVLKPSHIAASINI